MTGNVAGRLPPTAGRIVFAAAFALVAMLLRQTTADADDMTCDPGPYVQPLVESAPRISVELAQSDAERAQGLMYRQSLAWDSGMLFIFPQALQGGFWMRNTYIPLSIAFIIDDGTILDIQNMEPLTTDAHSPPGAYKYALEVAQGWFDANNVRVGDRVQLCLGR